MWVKYVSPGSVDAFTTERKIEATIADKQRKIRCCTAPLVVVLLLSMMEW